MFTLNCRGKISVLDHPWVMGIINTTPDSFFGGSRFDSDGAVQMAEDMIQAGAHILDIGGQSTRPGSKAISANEEMDRVIPAIQAIRKRFPAQLLSIDTFHAPVAAAALAAGADIINDVSAGNIDPDIIGVAAKAKAPYVLMHMRGLPATMQQQPVYDDVVTEVFDFLSSKVSELRLAGIHDILVDPGFGFGKTISQNFELLKNLRFFQQLGCPLMVGLSRKSSICKTLNIAPEQALNGSTVLHTLALLHGAHILRVHDVREAVEAVKLVGAVYA